MNKYDYTNKEPLCKITLDISANLGAEYEIRLPIGNDDPEGTLEMLREIIIPKCEEITNAVIKASAK